LTQGPFDIPQRLHRLHVSVAHADDSAPGRGSSGSRDVHVISNTHGTRISDDWLPGCAAGNILTSHGKESHPSGREVRNICFLTREFRGTWFSKSPLLARSSKTQNRKTSNHKKKGGPKAAPFAKAPTFSPGAVSDPTVCCWARWSYPCRSSPGRQP